MSANKLFAILAVLMIIGGLIGVGSLICLLPGMAMIILGIIILILTGIVALGKGAWSLASTKKCPYCQKKIPKDALWCEHCQHDLTQGPDEVVQQPAEEQQPPLEGTPPPIKTQPQQSESDWEIQPDHQGQIQPQQQPPQPQQSTQEQQYPVQQQTSQQGQKEEKPSSPSSKPDEASSRAKKLRELKQLRDEGLISEEEFKEKKKEILDEF
ncbi:MAG: SHOCT domain-containing protein [Candidatus Aenigmatarchaeota archaeon]